MSTDNASEELFEASALSICYERVAERVRSKLADYGRYSFTPRQTCAFNVFFDLAQEFESLDDLYALSVLIPKLFFDIDAELFTLDASGKLIRRNNELGPFSDIPPLPDHLAEGPHMERGCYHIPVRGRHADRENLPFTPIGDVFGMMVIHPRQPLTAHDKLYCEKFANRIGFQLHNRMLFQKNKEHIKFIRSLVHDIGHNVIVPNMYFKLLFRQLEGKIAALSAVQETLENDVRLPSSPTADAIRQFGHLMERLQEQYGELFRHFLQSSLFLETLLRQSHFDEGHYVLQKSTLDIAQRIVLPQMDRFRARLEEKGIDVPYTTTDDADPLLVSVDVGLISQVLANLLSNAVKYTRPDSTGHMQTRCDVVRVPDGFGPGADGIRIGVHTTGPAIGDEDSPRLFEPDFRGSNTMGEYGTGHGLHFVQEIVELHGGKAGYSRSGESNVFWMELPAAQT